MQDGVVNHLKDKMMICKDQAWKSIFQDHFVLQGMFCSRGQRTKIILCLMECHVQLFKETKTIFIHRGCSVQGAYQDHFVV